MTMRPTTSSIAVAFLLLGAGPCDDPPKPATCGVFYFSTPQDPYWPPSKPYPGPGRVTLRFTFKPAQCGAVSCGCRKVVFVQAIRFSLSPGNYKQPHDEQTDRMVHSSLPSSDGWAIDTLEGAIQPYYGMNDDGTFPISLSTPDLYSATPGSANSEAVLRDSPVSSEWDSYTIEAISVPVCLDTTSSCDRKILGYYIWSWNVPNKNSSDYGNFSHGPAWTDLYAQAFDEAAQAWNAHVDDGRQMLQLGRLP